MMANRLNTPPRRENNEQARKVHDHGNGPVLEESDYPYWYEYYISVLYLEHAPAEPRPSKVARLTSTILEEDILLFQDWKEIQAAAEPFPSKGGKVASEFLEVISAIDTPM